ncbi:hypothetical protein [Aquiflexum gelatinilyticum]|uniref:Uncharacterized protein n=1 Tax=Aquiflexum gelatinilyticum TaxID=2961943 RepID=A0A9X2PDY7_9BACT|nr:hypothetical protein [Aquiflexum gelatinilyticum]MCR9016975.1 hypothetical protein [Aquiflexum gelatinilyticum]MCS4433826.1 hypothetical protein [Aquiflexum gelatinilyticum]
MARQTGIFRFKGKMGGLDFYQSEGVDMVRTKTGPTTEQFKNDDAFENSRKNASEFGTASSVAGKLRRAILSKPCPNVDPNFNGRFTKLFVSILGTDPINPKGMRKVTAGDVSQLVGVNFTADSNLRSVLGGFPVMAEIKKGKSYSFDFGEVTASATTGKQQGQRQVIFGLVSLSEDAETVVVWQESEILDGRQSLSVLGEKVLSFETPQSHRLILGIVGIKFIDVVNGQTYTLKEGGAIGVVGCFK